MPFRFAAKAVGLTYSCPVDQDNNPITVHGQLKLAGEAFGPCLYIIGRELHANGKVHWHAYFKWDTRVQSTRPDVFDVAGVHPNIIRAPGAGWRAYCKKDKVYETNIEESVWRRALQQTTMAAALALIQANDPRVYILNRARIETNLLAHFRKPSRGQVYTEFKRPFENMEQATVILGPSGIGKTQWAKAHFKTPLFVRNINQLKNLRAEHDGIVFDDMDFTDWPRQHQIHLVDMEETSSIRILYGTAEIPAGMPRVFTCNTYPFREDPAVARRVRLLTLNERLY